MIDLSPRGLFASDRSNIKHQINTNQKHRSIKCIPVHSNTRLNSDKIKLYRTNLNLYSTIQYTPFKYISFPINFYYYKHMKFIHNEKKETKKQKKQKK